MKVTRGIKCTLSKDKVVNCSQGERFIETVRRVAASREVSERTARRYLKRGTMPPNAKERCIGQDGKRYPAVRRGYFSALHRPLAIARSNIRRAARAESFYEGDLALLRDLVMEARRLLLAWEDVTRGDKRSLTQKGKA